MKALVIASLFLLASCSHTASIEPHSDGLCKQVQEKKFLGITYKTDETYVNCGK